ncbi:MAG: hypothetical protein ACTHJT_00735 [Cytophaga sp.]|uniref:hypothetical protein n=1 Tax=Cytophaga sp. TaxID=29535 RepID=UPI003F7EAACD
MAILKGIIDLEGTLGDITVYTVNGKRVVRQKGGADKKKILRGKNYVRTRENMSEFGGAVAAAKVLRQSILSIARGFIDSNFTGRLQGKYRDMISAADGLRGQRIFRPLEHTEALLAIPFNPKLHLDSILRQKPVITVNAARTAATLSLPGFNPATDVFREPGATHVELIYIAVLQPGFEYDVHSKTYKRMDELHQHYMQTVSSALIPLTADELSDISLPAPAFNMPALHKDSALVSILGIRYHQQIGFKTYPLETGRVMGFVGCQ